MARARDVLAPCGVHSPEFQPKNSVANCRKCCNHPFLFNGAEAAMRDVMHAECDDTIVRCAGVWCGAVAEVMMMCAYVRGVISKP